jgi:hypothetical protein
MQKSRASVGARFYRVVSDVVLLLPWKRSTVSHPRPWVEDDRWAGLIRVILLSLGAGHPRSFIVRQGDLSRPITTPQARPSCRQSFRPFIRRVNCRDATG